MSSGHPPFLQWAGRLNSRNDLTSFYRSSLEFASLGFLTGQDAGLVDASDGRCPGAGQTGQFVADEGCFSDFFTAVAGFLVFSVGA